MVLINSLSVLSVELYLVDTHVPSSLGGMSAVILTPSCGWRYWHWGTHWWPSLRLKEEVKEAVGTSHSLVPVPATSTTTRGRKVSKTRVNNHTGWFFFLFFFFFKGGCGKRGKTRNMPFRDHYQPPSSRKEGNEWNCQRNVHIFFFLHEIQLNLTAGPFLWYIFHVMTLMCYSNHT